MKQLFLVLILFLFVCCTPKESLLSIDLTSKIVSPKNYIVSKTHDTIIIDGLADEACWQEAKYTDPFIDIEGIKIPNYETKERTLIIDTQYSILDTKTSN